MPGIYIVAACTLLLLVAMEWGRRLLKHHGLLHRLTGTWFWFILAWLVASITSLTAPNWLESILWAILVGFAQIIAMAVASWIIMRFRFRGRPTFRSWTLVGISYFAGCFTLWNASSFFGVPYAVMKLAFRGSAPLVFTVHECVTDAWTDFTASITAEFPAGSLEKALSGFDVTTAPNGERHFSWEHYPQGLWGASCSITTNRDQTIAKISYMAD